MGYAESGKEFLSVGMKIASYISSMYTFEEVAIQPVSIVQNPNGLQIQTNSIEISLEWSKGFTVPFRRSLFFIKNVESWFAKVFFKTKTYGITNNYRKEWYAINHLSKVIQCEGYMNNETLGTLSNIDERCGFGFSDPEKTVKRSGKNSHTVITFAPFSQLSFSKFA